MDGEEAPMPRLPDTPPVARTRIMDADFWLDLWARNHIPFHGRDVNPLLVAHLPALRLDRGARIFVPLCGKTRDIHWLLAQGFRVAGAELSPLAVTQLFDEIGVVPHISADGPLQRFSAPGLDIHAGDIFDLTATELGPVDAVYDRAALIALPADLRPRYAAHLARITGRVPQLVLSFERPPDDPRGPPFTVDAAEMRGLYGGLHALTLLERVALDRDPAIFDAVWLLR
jgi:thiopurine S-methyltransferase